MKWLILSITVMITNGLKAQIEQINKGKLPKKVEETSGLETCDGKTLFTHNDSGGEAIIYEVDLKGKLLQEYPIDNATNIDWEELTIDKDGNLYIADIGNNANKRKDLTIYKVAEFCQLKNKGKVETIQYNYANQNSFPPKDSRKIFDAEAMIHFGDSLYIFTKNRTEPYNGMVYLYGIPDKQGNYTASLLDSAKLGGKSMNFSWVTAADIRPDEQEITLLSMNKVWTIQDFKGSHFLKGTIREKALPSYSQKEAIVYTNQNSFFVTDEKFQLFGLQLYHFQYTTP